MHAIIMLSSSYTYAQHRLQFLLKAYPLAETAIPTQKAYALAKTAVTTQKAYPLAETAVLTQSVLIWNGTHF